MSELCLGSKVFKIADYSPAFVGPLRRAKSLAAKLSREDFRITVYECFRAGHPRINVEVQGSRYNRRHTWKKTRLCDTEADAISFVREVDQQAEQGLLTFPRPK